MEVEHLVYILELKILLVIFRKSCTKLTIQSRNTVLCTNKVAYFNTRFHFRSD